MKVKQYNPLQPLSSFGDDINSLFKGTWPTFFTDASTIDMYEEAGKLKADVSLPNFKKEEISVSAENGMLEVNAETSRKEGEKNDRRYYMRESRSQLVRRVSLPEGAQAGKIEANFKDGVLHLVMPMALPKKPKKVEIK